MRTLKKTLALVLVLAMMFSLCITASADFTDADEITYVEAADVMAAIGVIEGMPDGSFDYAGTLTRAQAAVMITRMLGATDYAIATEGEFTDVAANHWAAGAISFCVDAGIVAGYGDGTFGPSDELTAYQWAKMLLCALGYNAESEGMTGSAWQIAVAKLAKNEKLFTGNEKADKTQAVSREEAALYAFNTLAATVVEYKGGSSVTVGDITFTSGGELKDTEVPFMTEYFAKLAKADLTAKDNGGLAATMWWVNGDKLLNGFDATKDTLVGVYETEEVAATYAAGTKYVDIAKALGVKNSTKEYTVELYRNGDYKATQTLTGATILAMTDVIPNGIVVDVVVTETGVIRLLINVYYLGVITKADVTADVDGDDMDERSVVITKNDTATTYTLTALNCADFEAIFAAASALKTGEKLYYVIQPEGDTDADNAALLTLNEAKTVTGAITATAAAYVKIAGETYKLSSVSGLSIGSTGLVYNKLMPQYVYVLDNNGFILDLYAVETAPVVTDYVALLAYEYKAPVAGSLIDSEKAPVAKLQVMDLESGEVKLVDRAVANDNGTYKFVEVDGTYGSAVADGKYTYAAPVVFEYVVLEDGTYALGSRAAADKTVALAKNVAAVAADLTATSKTEVKVVEWTKDATTGAYSAKVTSYTGIANFPAAALQVSYNNAIVDMTVAGDTVASILVVAQAQEAAPEYTFGVYAGAGEFDGKYRYNFIVDGAVATYETKTEVKVGGSALQVGAVYCVDLDATTNAVTAVANDNIKTGAVAVLDSTYVKAGDNYIYFAEGCTILDAGKEFAAGEISVDPADTITAYGAVKAADGLFYATLIVIAD